MLSRRTRLFAVLALVTAALGARAAVFVPEAHACSLIAVQSPSQLVPDTEVVLIAEVIRVDAQALVLKPEAFLKGPASSEQIVLPAPGNGIHATLQAQGAECPRVRANGGERLLVFIADADSPHYPYLNEAYVLRDGQALMDGQAPLSEAEVVSSIRAITGQYAVPAATRDEGAGIDWKSTVLPVGIALAIIFAIGLVLMRTWHRIDPS